MTPHDISLPDARLHLAKLAKPLASIAEACTLEIRSIKEEAPTLSWRINPLNPNEDLDQVLIKIAELNVQGYNIYTTVNPANSNGQVGKACSAHDIIAATYLFLDADDEGIAKRIIQDDQLEFIKEEIDALVTVGKKPELIIIDTLARNFGGGDENATKDMSEFIDAVDALINRYGAAALIVHHSGHSDKLRSRGNSALKAALDAEYKISKNERFVYLNCTKMKDAEELEALNFVLEDITISDTFGNGIQTVVPIKRTGKVERFRLTPNDTKNLEQFREAYIELHGEYNSDNSISLTLDEWRPIFYKKHHGDNQDTKRKAFERARKSLVSKVILDVSDDIYTFTPKSTGRVQDIIKTENDDYASKDRTDLDTPLEGRPLSAE